MKTAAYLAIAFGGLVALLAVLERSLVGFALGVFAALGGAILLSLGKLDRRLELIEDRLTEISQGALSTEAVIDQLRQEGLLRRGDGINDESVQEILNK